MKLFPLQGDELITVTSGSMEVKVLNIIKKWCDYSLPIVVGSRFKAAADDGGFMYTRGNECFHQRGTGWNRDSNLLVRAIFHYTGFQVHRVPSRISSGKRETTNRYRKVQQL